MKKLKTVLVDNSIQFRQALKSVVKNSGILEVLGEASSGVEAIELASSLQPDIIIMDINLPIMNGMEAGGMIKKMYPETKIIILSVYKDPDYIEEYNKNGLDAYLVKGEDDTKLIETIKNIFNLN